MPCSDGGPTPRQWEIDIRKRLDAATRAACELKRAADSLGVSLAVTPETAQWLSWHKDEDRRREASAEVLKNLDMERARKLREEADRIEGEYR